MVPLDSKPKLFHSFIPYPRIKFESQLDGEKIILLLRAHPITQLFWVMNSFIFFLILLTINYFVSPYISTTELILLYLAGIFFILSYTWYNFLIWFFNVGIVTNQRVIDIDFSGITYKEINATRLNKIEDVTSKSVGYFGSLFNYGDVFVQTAGAEVNIEFFKVPHVSEVSKIINELMPSNK